MPCESYQSTLSEAAAGAPASAALRAHLIVCADCRAALAVEASLFASIDAALRSVANAEVPASLVPSVRARLNEPAPRKRWLLPVLVPAAAALVVTAFAARSFRHTPADPSNFTPSNTAASVPSATRPAPTESLPSVARADQGHRMAVASHAPRRAVVALAKTETRDVPEVLVPRDQELLLASYAQQWRSHKYVRVTAEEISKPPLEPVEIAPIQIDVRDVKLLTDSDSR